MDHTIEVRAMRPGEHLYGIKEGRIGHWSWILTDSLQYLYKLKF